MYSCKEGDYVSETPGTCPTHNTPLEELCSCGSGKFSKDCCAAPTVASPAEPAEGAAPEAPAEAAPAQEAPAQEASEAAPAEEAPAEEQPPAAPAQGM
jgi:hypothetical protein